MNDEKPKKRGRWKAGESGNPNGRPTGVNRTQALRDALGSERLNQVVDMLVRKALDEGDVQAARVLLDRCIPALRAVEPAIEPLITAGDSDVLASANQVMRAVLMGVIPPSQGVVLMNGLNGLAQLRESLELEARILALENMKPPEGRRG